MHDVRHLLLAAAVLVTCHTSSMGSIVEPGTAIAIFGREAAMSGFAPNTFADFREREGAGASGGSGFGQVGSGSSPAIVRAEYAHRSERLFPVDNVITISADSGVSGSIAAAGGVAITATGRSSHTFDFTVLEPVQYELSGTVAVVVHDLVGSCAPVIYASANVERWPGGVPLVSAELTEPVGASISLSDSGVLVPGKYYIDLVTFASASASSGSAKFDFDVSAVISMSFTPVPGPSGLLCAFGTLCLARRRR